MQIDVYAPACHGAGSVKGGENVGYDKKLW